MEEYKWIIYQIWWVNRTRFSSFILAHSLIILLVVFQQAVYEVDSYFFVRMDLLMCSQLTFIRNKTDKDVLISYSHLFSLKQI